MRFAASYDSTTRWLSAALFGLMVVVAVVAHTAWAALVAVAAIGIAYAWSPRGYSLDGRAIVVDRLIGAVRFPLEGVSEARMAHADDFSGCIRLWGNGGLFGYYGLFQTSKLGRCTWYLTNKQNAVVVRTAAKTALFSPDDCEGFLAAIRANAPVPPSDPTLNALGSCARGSIAGPLIGAGIAVVVLGVVAASMLYNPGPPKCTLTADTLAIHDRFYPVTVRASEVDVSGIRVIDLNRDTAWKPTERTDGFGNPHYASGKFRVASGQSVRMYRAGGKRLVLFPPKGAGLPVLVDAGDPDAFAASVRRQWGSS